MYQNIMMLSIDMIITKHEMNELYMQALKKEKEKEKKKKECIVLSFIIYKQLNDVCDTNKYFLWHEKQECNTVLSANHCHMRNIIKD